MKDSHNRYVLDELIADERFQNYCLKKNTADVEYWQDIIFKNWSQRLVFEEAYDAVVFLSDSQIYDGRPLATKVVPLKQIGNEVHVVKKGKKKWTVIGAVASCLLLIAFSISFLQPQPLPAMLMVATDVDEVKTVVLPDGSTAILNGNSTMTYPKEMFAKNRYVTFSGEVFFEVQSTLGKDQFTVKSKYGNIVVTGTKFNLKDRGEVFESTLIEGAIIFQKDNMDDILMSAGDQLIVKNNTIKIVRTRVEEVTAWQEGRIVFKDRSMREVIMRLKQNYGLEVVVHKKSLMNKKISANMVTKDPLLLLQSIGAIYDFEVVSDEGQVVLK